MSGINKVLLIGNVGKDPEVRYMNNGDAVVNLTLATSETWKDKNTGQKQEKTEWHRVTIFGGLAKIAADYVHKGSKLYLEGKLQTRKWQDNSGNDRYTTEVVLDMKGVLQMLDSAGSSGGGNNNQNQNQNQNASQNNNQQQGGGQQQQGYQQQNNQNQQQNNQNQQQQYDDEFSDDIPF